MSKEIEFSYKICFSNGRSTTVDAYPDDGSTGGLCIAMSGGMKGNGMVISADDAEKYARVLIEAVEFARKRYGKKG